MPKNNLNLSIKTTIVVFNQKLKLKFLISKQSALCFERNKSKEDL